MLSALDVRLLRLMRTRGHWPGLENAAIGLARSGESGLLWHGLAAGGALLQRSRRAEHLRAMWILLVTLVANSLVKQAVRRARPVLEEELPAPPLYALALSMALTRPYLGVHYPSDIVAGALLGDALARLMTP